MTVATNGQQTDVEPDVEQRAKRQHAMGAGRQAWLRFRARPVWRQVLTGTAVVAGAGYLSWTFLAGPIIERRVDAAVAREDIAGQVQAIFDRDSDAFTDQVLERVDARVREAQNGLPPVVVQKADLQAMLACPLTPEAKLMIGADAADPTRTGLDPARQEQVAAAVRQAGGQGVPETAMRVVPNGANLAVTTDANQGARLIDCAAPTTTTAATAITPPAGAN